MTNEGLLPVANVAEGAKEVRYGIAVVETKPSVALLVNLNVEPEEVFTTSLLI